MWIPGGQPFPQKRRKAKGRTGFRLSTGGFPQAVELCFRFVIVILLCLDHQGLLLTPRKLHQLADHHSSRQWHPL